jgi:putative MATE family efflux protein
MDSPAAPRAGSGEAGGGDAPRFVTGSTMRHVLVMTGTGAVGLIAIFFVDFLSLLYISWLGDPSLTAAVGLGTVVLFLTTSINVGLMIAVSALVSRALGAGDRQRARRLATTSCIHMAVAAALVSVALLAILPWILVQLRASEEVHPVASSFLWITMPSNVLMALGMGFSAVLRAVGDAKRGMYVTLTAAVVTLFLDPLLIFGLGLGTDGAAIAIVVSRAIFVYVGFNGAARVHDLLERPRLGEIRADARVIYAIALPAVATNVATPLANGFFVRVLGQYGDEAIAATAIVDRIVPVAFGGLFALSGAVGPILGQNWGARRFDRMRQALRDAVLFMAAYVVVVWLLLVLLGGPITVAFNAQGLTADLVQFFCLISGSMWFFIGLLFVANASFNNLGFPLLSTAFNWGRSTLGVIPFALVGASLAGPQGAMAGLGVGAVPFGVAAIVTAFWTIGKLERRSIRGEAASDRLARR